MNKKSPKYKNYGQSFTEEVIWNARVFLCLQGSCLKSHLQDMLKEMTPGMKDRLDGREADNLLKELDAHGMIKTVEYNKNKASPKIYTIAYDGMQKIGSLNQLLEGIFRYWLMNIYRKKRKGVKFDPEHNEFLSTQKWEWGKDFIKKWANFVENDMTDEMKDQFKAIVENGRSIPELYKSAKTKTDRMD